MSTPLLGPERFANLRDSLYHHATNEIGPGSASAVNGELMRALDLDPWGRTNQEYGAPADIPNALKSARARIGALVFDWQRANWAAHVVRYQDQAEAWQEQKGPAAPTPKLPRGEVLGIPATLKALRALRYNCDGGEASGPTVKESLAVLDRIIDDLKDNCLEMLPEYQAAEWAI